MVIYHFTGKYLQKLPGVLLSVLSAAAYVLTGMWTGSVIVESKLLYPFGFKYRGFSSADYFPLLPWLFLFLIGTALGGWCLKNRENRLLTTPLPRAWKTGCRG